MSPGAPEFLVVGAGPAGSSLALRLARRGRRVRLLDATDFPRSKPCGDCLSPGATPLLEELGVIGALRERQPGRLTGWRLRTPGGRWFHGRFSPERSDAPAAGYALPREELDHVLITAAREAGVDFLPRRRVFRLVRVGGRVEGVEARGPSGDPEVHRAPLVVGADGLRSAVARRIGTVHRGTRRRLALVRRYGGVAGRGGTGEMRLSAAGCLGYAPVGASRVNLTLVVDASRAREISAGPEEFFRENLRSYGVADDVDGARPLGPIEVTGPFELSPDRITCPGVMLVGDAAGYFDPFTGQGVYRALAGARLAARYADRLVSEGDGSRGEARTCSGEPPVSREERLLARYERDLRRLLRPGQALQRLVDTVVSRRPLAETYGRLARRVPGLTSLLVDATGDRIRPAELARPRVLLDALKGDPLESGADRPFEEATA